MTFSFNPIIKQPIKYFSPVLLFKIIISLFSQKIYCYTLTFQMEESSFLRGSKFFQKVSTNVFQLFFYRYCMIDIYSMYDLRVICFLLLFNLRILNYLSCTQLMILPHNRTLVMIMVLIEL